MKTNRLQDGITLNEMEQFRKGHYKEADPYVQRKWCHVMLHFLPCACSSYHKWDIKKTTLISKVSHATYEVLVMWFLKCYLANWDKIYDDQQQVQEEQKANKHCRKDGKHKSNELLGEYMNLHASIKLARSEKGKVWEEALMEEARIQDEQIHNMSLADNMPNAPLANQGAKKTFVMLFSEDKENLQSLGGNVTDNTPVKNKTKV
jgi:hypothetical protein